MPTSKVKGLDEQLLEGGGGPGVGGGGGGYRTGKQGQSVNTQAAKNAAKNDTSSADEMIKLDKMLTQKRELEAVKSKPERQAAEKNAVTTQEGGVKKTVYPYAGPNEYKKGGMTASKRADGIAQRGKTKGKIV
jgi:hypothetical protein